MTSNRPTISTFGCRLNIWESELIRQHATHASMNITVFLDACVWTAEVEKRARQKMLRGYGERSLRYRRGVRLAHLGQVGLGGRDV